MSLMKTASLLLLACSASALSVDFGDKAWKERPVTKVINLLRDMQGQLEKEAESDEELYAKVQCWCETNDKTKTKAIEIANKRITDLVSSIEENTARSAQLEVEIEKLGKEVAEKTAAMEEAAGIRSNENGEFTSDETDLSASIGSLGGAVTALGKAHGEGFTQASMMQVQHVLSRHYETHKKMFSELSSAQHSTVMSLLQQPVAAQSYNSQSGAIFGILKQMKETFETNLSNSQNDETQAVKEFGMLKSSKNKEITAANAGIDAKTQELADTKETLSTDKEDLEDTRAALASDTTFLDNLKSRCQSIDQQWEERSKMRAEEIKAVSETIAILDDDDAHDTFNRSLGFLQTKAKDTTRNAGVAALAQAAKKFNNPRISALAVSSRSDVFAKVKENISKLVEELKKTQVEEVEQRDFCISEIMENEDQTVETTNHKQDLEQKIEDLTALIEANTESIANSQKEIADMKIQMKAAGENRESENKEFQMTVADQRATQQILAKALTRLNEFYAKKALLQTKTHQPSTEPGAASEAMPGGFKSYSKAGQSAGAVALLEMIIKESAGVERKAVEDENEDQKDYETFMTDSNASIATLNNDITDKSEELAKADGDKTRAAADLENRRTDLFKLGDYNRELHRQCDYLLDNFKVRQSARADEIDSLDQAKAMFSGANFR